MNISYVNTLRIDLCALPLPSVTVCAAADQRHCAFMVHTCGRDGHCLGSFKFGRAFLWSKAYGFKPKGKGSFL